MPDLMLEAGTIQPKSPFYTAETSSGQYSLGNSARAWTKVWLMLKAVGWRPIALPRSSHRVRVSFKFGKDSFIGDLTSNPRFYELMMGWPIGWSAPGERVTGYAAWLRRSRTELSRLTMLAAERDREANRDA